MQRSYRNVKKKLKKLGCVETNRKTRGSHRKWMNPATNKMTVIPDSGGGKEISEGTLRDAIAQLGIDWVKFKNI